MSSLAVVSVPGAEQGEQVRSELVDLQRDQGIAAELCWSDGRWRRIAGLDRRRHDSDGRDRCESGRSHPRLVPLPREATRRNRCHEGNQAWVDRGPGMRERHAPAGPSADIGIKAAQQEIPASTRHRDPLPAAAGTTPRWQARHSGLGIRAPTGEAPVRARPAAPCGVHFHGGAPHPSSPLESEPPRRVASRLP